MVPHTDQKNRQSLLTVFLILSVSFPLPINASTKKLEEIVPAVVVPEAPATEIKCETCPCVNPCGQQSLPPPPPPPPPPPCPPPPPPPPRFTYCCNPLPMPPPPPPRFYYVTGVPGQLYTVDPDDRWTFFAKADRNAVAVSLLLLCYGLLGLFTVY